MVIGIENMKKLLVHLINLDAKYFAQYAKKVARSQNIITLVDVGVTRNESIAALVKHLNQKLKKMKLMFIYFFQVMD